MRVSGWLVTAALTLIGAAALAQPGATPTGASAERLQALIAGLGSGQFREREAASRQLDALGEAALGALRRAAHSGDPETRHRVAELSERIDSRLTTARILTPTLLELDYKDTPLAVAVEDLAKRTGAPITLQDLRPSPFQGRAITIATGPLPFWQALEQFCRKADLHELDRAVQPPSDEVKALAQMIQQLGNPGQGPIIIRGTLNGPYSPNVFEPIILIDSAAAAVPAHQSGAVRVRTLPPGAPFRVPDAGADYVVPLQVSAEPRLQSQGVVGLRVFKAIDDQGQSLSATAVRAASELGAEKWVVLNGALVPLSSLHRNESIGVRLRRGAKPAKNLRELTGSATIQVRVPGEEITLDGPAAVAGTTVRGEHGVTLKLSDFTRHVGDELRVTVELELPPGVGLVRPGLGRGYGEVPDTIVSWSGPRVVGPLDGRAVVPDSGTDFLGLRLEDGQGRRLKVIRGAPEVKPTAPEYGCHINIFTSFHVETGAELARLVFTATRPAAVDVPFVLKDVPLR